MTAIAAVAMAASVVVVEIAVDKRRKYGGRRRTKEGESFLKKITHLVRWGKRLLESFGI